MTALLLLVLCIPIAVSQIQLCSFYSVFSNPRKGRRLKYNICKVGMKERKKERMKERRAKSMKNEKRIMKENKIQTAAYGREK
jgi:hypothetical protein